MLNSFLGRQRPREVFFVFYLCWLYFKYRLGSRGNILERPTFSVVVLLVSKPFPLPIYQRRYFHHPCLYLSLSSLCVACALCKLRGKWISEPNRTKLKNVQVSSNSVYSFYGRECPQTSDDLELKHAFSASLKKKKSKQLDFCLKLTVL